MKKIILLLPQEIEQLNQKDRNILPPNSGVSYTSHYRAHATVRSLDVARWGAGRLQAPRYFTSLRDLWEAFLDFDPVSFTDRVTGPVLRALGLKINEV